MLRRDTYGRLSGHTLVTAALELAQQAAARGKIPAERNSLEWGKRGRERGKLIGYARHHDVYDVTPDGRRALICVREVEGTKYGVRTSGKTYYIVSRHGAGIRVTEANKAIAARAAKAAGTTLGKAVDVCLGKTPLRQKPQPPRTGYKLVARTDQPGVYASVWDQSRWELGKVRVQAATDDHTGGYYYYATLDECLAAAQASAVFGRYRDHDHLAVIEVEASGRHYAHTTDHGTKLCATRVRPVREVGSTLSVAA